MWNLVVTTFIIWINKVCFNKTVQILNMTLACIHRVKYEGKLGHNFKLNNNEKAFNNCCK
jgi:hypothetical protein